MAVRTQIPKRESVSLTKFQKKTHNMLSKGKSVLLIAPTGLGKTIAVTGDIQEKFCKTVYAVPLRALGGDIKQAIAEFRRNNEPIQPVVHHGDIQESMLFSEEVVITTYDQIVCGVPGLPLSLSLKAGHAVAGALLMSRLILDEAHLAWSISEQALAILLAIIDSRTTHGLQTVVLTATLPDAVAELISERLGLELLVVGEKDLIDDEGLELRNRNRKVIVSLLELKNKGKADDKKLDYSPLIEKLTSTEGKRIYFANTVERIQVIFDELINRGVDATTINVLHNRMPRSWRSIVEEQVHRRFGKGSPDGDWILLTNQVAEAGLDISAPLVVSDPAPVDTLVQRAGRCARWFRIDEARGTFLIINAPKDATENRKTGLALPYRADLVQAALRSIPEGELTWQAERTWVNGSWGGDPEKAKKAAERALHETDFALNLFDRAAQERKPGEIARTFREILTVDVAVESTDSSRDLQSLLDAGERPETSSVSLGKANSLLREARGKAYVIRYDEGIVLLEKADYVRTGDVLVVPSNIAYLHRLKGLCFGNGLEVAIESDVFLSSEWKSDITSSRSLSFEDGRRQGLLEHVMGVMEGTYQRLSVNGTYRNTLVKILKGLEPEKDPHKLADVITQIATLAAGFHDLGKADYKWQAKVRQIDPERPDGLIGRTLKTQSYIGIPHTYPGYLATIVACQMLMNYPDSSKHLVRAIALAGVRHHSSMMNPALMVNRFEPHREANDFVSNILREIGAPGEVIDRVNVILDAAKGTVPQEMVPLLLPNDDLFPIYALVGRAILMADRENAAGKDLEQWRVS